MTGVQTCALPISFKLKRIHESGLYKAVSLQASHQRMKMETMQEKDLQAVQAWQRKQEQKQMDALGVTLYNLKA